MKKTKFAEGKRGIVYLIKWKGKKAIRKEKKKLSKALGTIENEIYFLKILNKNNLGPKLYDYGKDYLIEEFVDGKRILDFLKDSKKRKTISVLKEVLRQARLMDKLQIDKKEMTNPYKHILITDKKIVMIDFERCRINPKPRNVSQFVQFLTSKKVKEILKEKGIKIPAIKARNLAQNYKKRYLEKDFKKILSLF